MPETAFRAVIFDLGGVVLGSPLRAFLEYERDSDLPPGLLGRTIAYSGAGGAWSQLERGELDSARFCAALEAEVAAAGARIRANELMERIALASPVLEPMLAAVRRVRAHGLLAGALTNNWRSDDQHQKVSQLRPEFDAFVESWREGMRKPEPGIYRLALQRLAVEPEQVVFLDDLGQNLKPARAMGMTTIKVSEPLDALGELERVLGLSLR